MRFTKIKALTFVLLFAGSFAASAQWDDVYFDPSTDASLTLRNQDRDRNSDRYEEEYTYYDDEYQYYNDYDFYYTSRIRRFNRPFYGFGFYDPVYVDAFYYDPFFRPGLSVLIYDDFYTNRSWSRFRPWASPFNTAFGFNSWNNRLWSNIGFGYSPWSPINRPWFGFNGYSCPPSWGGNNTYANVSNVYSDGRASTFGPRRSSRVSQPRLDAPVSTTAAGRTVQRGALDDQRVSPYTGRSSVSPNSRNGRVERNTLSTEGRNSGRRAVSSSPRSRENTINSGRRASNSRSTRARSSSNRTINTNRSTRSTGNRSYTPSRRSSSPSSINRSSRTRSTGSSVRSSSSRSRSSSTRSSSSRTSTRKKN